MKWAAGRRTTSAGDSSAVRLPRRRARPAARPERGLGLLGDDGERSRIGDRDVGERLAVELDPGLVHARHELVVREAVLPRRRVDADDPEAAERALLVLAVAVGIGERMLDLLLGVRVVRVLEAPVALRLLEDLPPLLARGHGSLHPGHRLLHPQEALHGRDVRLARRADPCGSRAYASSSCARGCGSSSRAGGSTCPFRSP